VNVMRYTVIDERGTVSFVADCAALLPMVSACADGAQTLEDLLEAVDRSGFPLKEYVTSGLAVFDEHNSPTNLRAIHAAIAYFPPHELPVFRVLDDITRQASLQPVKAGAIIFNLPRRRIIQLQNSYAEIRRMGTRMRRLQRAGWQVLP